MPDLIPLWEQPRAPEATVVPLGSEQEINPLVPELRIPYYAFLDDVEEVSLDEFEAMPTLAWAPPRPLQPDESLLVARFDCILVEHFNSALAPHRLFYAQRLGKDIDQPREDNEVWWHDPDQTREHRALNHALLDVTDERLVTVFLTFPNTPEARERFAQAFPHEGWFGLGLSNTSGLPVEVTYGDDSNQPNRYALRYLCGVYRVDATRLNNLRHVFSLDFAPDAYFPPDPYGPNSEGEAAVIEARAVEREQRRRIEAAEALAQEQRWKIEQAIAAAILRREPPGGLLRLRKQKKDFGHKSRKAQFTLDRGVQGVVKPSPYRGRRTVLVHRSVLVRVR
ncbi:hypothetical protein HPC49_16900 [Pyxidicoccus fallax]|uniref:Uncharacterized protein n=1 Tax=Pyxidicoccus fallax TaxID=394095 RepID=A0A848LND0_9BACT|nr:hypothetical protein [Pyxidicoccus fallax]NMO19211.1 hypothetical protein [Pyxidicoccus fallax]NPC79894.1 hypothetical protein [Pyxidicoccus fallax]